MSLILAPPPVAAPLLRNSTSYDAPALTVDNSAWAAATRETLVRLTRLAQTLPPPR